MMMKEKQKLKKIAAAVLAAGLCLLTVSGCSGAAESQDEVVRVKEQDGESMSIQLMTGEDVVFGNVAEQVQAPETYQAEVSNGTVRIKADAVVTIPDVPGIKLKKVIARTFTQADYDAVNKVLLSGGKLWSRDYEAMAESHGFFREELDERIAELEKKITQDGMDGDTTYGVKGTTLNQQIEELKALREKAFSAQEAATMGLIQVIPAIVSYDKALSEAGENELYGNVVVNGYDYWIQIDNNAKASSHCVQFMIGKQDGNGNYLPFSNLRPEPEQMEDITLKPGFENMNIPAEKVCAEATEAINQMGLGEYAIQGGGYFACYSMDDAVADSPTYLAGIGYGVHFVRVVDGIPITYTYEDGGQIIDEDAIKWSQAVAQEANGENVVPEITYWPFEEMMLIYNNDGFCTFEWQNPYTVEDLSEEYAFLLPFSDISTIFEEMLLKKQADSFNSEGYTVDIQVDRVVLSYMRVREKGAMEGTLIPVWDFFGTQSYKSEVKKEVALIDRAYDGVNPESIMTINAMDGTIVDRGTGY